MAENLDDCEFWLPPQFLTDDDILMDFTKSNQNVNKKNGDANSGLLFPNEYPWGLDPYSSGLSSPVESVVSSTETESDEEDFLAGLTRKMARSALVDDFLKSDSGLGYESPKTWCTAGSPHPSFIGRQSCKKGSNRGSPNGPSLAASPPTAAKLNWNDAAWKLLHAAAAELTRMRMTNTNEAGGGYLKEGLFCSPLNPRPVLKKSNTNPGFPDNNKSLSYQQLQLLHFQQLKQQQMMKQQQGTTIWRQPEPSQVFQNRPRTGGRPLGLSPSAWPSLPQSQQHQPQTSSGMRALFLGPNGSKRVCAGTGVFLPRRVGCPTESRKKPGCSTVLLPDRVVQALNLHLDNMEARTHLQPQYSRTLSPDHDATLKYRNYLLMAQQKWDVRAQSTAMNQELRLPSEWSY